MARRQVKTMERDAKALDMYYRGLSYRKIAEQMKWRSPAAAHQAVRRAIADHFRLSSAEAIEVEEQRLDQLQRAFNRVLATEHYVHSANGTVVRHPETDEPLIDDGPVIAAGLALLRTSESRRKLRGLDRPAKVEVRNVDALDARLEELADEMGPMEPRHPQGVPEEA